MSIQWELVANCVSFSLSLYWIATGDDAGEQNQIMNETTGEKRKRAVWPFPCLPKYYGRAGVESEERILFYSLEWNTRAEKSNNRRDSI